MYQAINVINKIQLMTIIKSPTCFDTAWCYPQGEFQIEESKFQHANLGMRLPTLAYMVHLTSISSWSKLDRVHRVVCSIWPLLRDWLTVFATQ